jgi:Ca2+-binding RTX toxin-like protein
MSFSFTDSDEITGNAVTEGAPAGTYTGLTVSATSASGQPMTYAITGAPPGVFEIDPVTGRVTIADGAAIDYETLSSSPYYGVDAYGYPALRINVQASDGLTSQTQEFQIRIDDFAGDQLVDSDEITGNAVTEGAPAGTYTGITASFVSPLGLPVTYAIQGGPGGTFDVDPVTGRVTLVAPEQIDYEALRDNGFVDPDGRVYIPVTIYGGDGLSIDSETFKIYVDDLQLVDADIVDNAVAEGTPTGTYTGITASFGTGTGIVYSLLDSANGVFTIDPATGRVLIADGTAIDYEGLIAAGQVDQFGRPYMEVTVGAGPSSSLILENEKFRIYVDDVSLVDSDSTANEILENALPGTYTGLDVSTSLNSGGSATYSLQNDGGGAFYIDAITGQVFVQDFTKLDYEALLTVGNVDEDGNVYIEITATLNGTANETATFRIFVRDLQLFDANNAENRIIEHATDGTQVGITAKLVAPIGGAAVYGLDTNPYDAFTIDSETGLITIIDQNALDFEALSADPAHVDAQGRVFVDVTVRAGIGNAYELEDFRVYLDDFRIIDTDNTRNTVTDSPSYGTYTGLTIGMLLGSSNGPVTYSLVTDTVWSTTASNWGNMFQLDSVTGRLTVRDNGSLDIEWLRDKGQVDAEGNVFQDVRIEATDGINTEQQTFRIYVEGNRAYTLYDSDSGVNTVQEFGAAGTYTGVTARAISKHGLEMKYHLNLARDGGVSLSNAAHGWAIDIDTGVVTIKEPGSINWTHQYGFATINWYSYGYVPYWDGQTLYSQVVVRATDGIDIYERTFRVRLTDAAHPPGFEVTDTDRAFNSVLESAFAGDYFGLTAGMVKGETGITYSLVNDADGRFVIDAMTGQVTVAGGVALDYETAGLLAGGPDRGYTIRIRAEKGTEVIERNFIIRVEDNPNETPSGTSGDDVLIAPDDQNWTLNGFAGNDVIRGRAGNDILNGGDGNDTIIGGVGADTLIGGAGIDTLSYVGSPSGVTVNLATNAATGGDATGDVISGFENLIGSDHNDTLTGSATANEITGGAGDDTMNGGGGNDTFLIGQNSGTDTIIGGAGTDTVRFTADDAVLALSSLAGVEMFDATGYSNVTITGTDSNNNLNFSAATLLNIVGIYGLGGNDTITGSISNDILYGRGGNDTLRGGDGDDRFRFEGNGEGFDNIDGGSGQDTIEATSTNTIIGLTAMVGIEAISGQYDTIIQGSGGANTLDFSAVTLTGIALIDGGAGADIITGSVGHDTIRGGAGNDTLRGGDGNDAFLVNGTSEGNDLYDGGADFDQILARSDGTIIRLGATIAGIERIASNGYSSVSIAGTTTSDSWDFSGTMLDDIATVSSGAGDDVVIGSAGDDIIIGGAGADTLNGGGGSNTLSYAGSATGVTINLLAMTASGGDAAGDVISNFHHVIGSNGADTLIGNDADNQLSGGSGADRLTGGLGVDTLTGGAGGDVFVFNASAEASGDFITDFVRGPDKIDLLAIDANLALAGDQNFSFIGGGAFTNVAGQLRYDNTQGDGFTHILGDANGDGVTDFQIRLNGIYTMAATDFIWG